jgi:hypothetical protein
MDGVLNYLKLQKVEMQRTINQIKMAFGSRLFPKG